MKTQEDTWFENILDSAKGSSRAQPSPDLLLRIEQQLGISETRIISIASLRWAIGIAAMLVLFNGIALYQYSSSQQDSGVESQLFLDTQLYN